MCSLPSLISSSCRPSLFFSGHFESSSLQVCQSSIKFGMAEDILHDFALLNDPLDLADKERADTHLDSQYHSLSVLFFQRTLFSYQGIIAVVGVVCVAR